MGISVNQPKKGLGAEIVDMNDLDVVKPQHQQSTDKVEGSILAGSDLKSLPRNKGGRKKKEVKADVPVKMYVTPEEKTIIEAHCVKMRISESTLLKQLLVKEGIL